MSVLQKFIMDDPIEIDNDINDGEIIEVKQSKALDEGQILIIKTKYGVIHKKPMITQVKKQLVFEYEDIDEKKQPEQINSNQEKKKWNPYVMGMINSQNYQKDKLSFSSSPFQTITIVSPFYQYSSKTQEPLHIQTNFLNLEKNSISYKEFRKYHDDNKGFVMKLLPGLFESSTINMLLDYDRQIKTFINNPNINCTDKLIYNKDVTKLQPQYQNDPIHELDFGSIKCKLSKKISKVTNYNISKKYSKVEEFNGMKNKLSEFFDIFDRILSEKKQVRLVFSPMTWINGNKYGSYIMIHNMEIKFKDAKISSVLDTESKTMHDEITSITI